MSREVEKRSAAKVAAPVLTLDGPTASGKGTVAHRLAQALGFHVLDSGSLYRVLALAAEHHAVSLDNAPALQVLAAHLDVQFSGDAAGETRIVLEGEDVSKVLRTEACGRSASLVAALPDVRLALLDRQRAFREAPGLVADGRDMGTVVFPDACLKIFLTASVEERAQRRYRQLLDKGFDASLAALSDDIRARDERDTQRSVAPLRPADDAIVLDSTDMTADDVVRRIMELARHTPSLGRRLQA